MVRSKEGCQALRGPIKHRRALMIVYPLLRRKQSGTWPVSREGSTVFTLRLLSYLDRLPSSRFIYSAEKELRVTGFIAYACMERP